MRFVFIDSRITDISNIVAAFTPDTYHYVFDWHTSIFQDFKDILAQQQQQYETVGIIQHNFYESTYKLLFNTSDSIVKNVAEEDSGLTTWTEYIELLQWIKTNCNTSYIDLFACDIWIDPDWKYIIQTIASQYDISIRASINITGEGGDFILESDNFNTIGIYFTEDILQYKYAFSYQTYAPFEPYGNRYSSTYVLPDSNPGTLRDIYRSTSTAITFPTLSSNITNVKYVVSNGNAAVVRLVTGNAVVIGTTANGGNPSQTVKDILNTSTDVVKIVCNDTAFCAIYRVSGDNRRRVVHWGYYGASDIETIGTGNAGFNNISTVQSSLNLVDISDIAVNQTGAFAVLDTAGDVYAWGDKATGGDPANATNTAGVAGGISTLLAGTDATFGLCVRLICGQKHFGVISSNRLGVVWGNKTSATSGGFIYNTSVTGVDDILLATDNLQNCVFLRIPETTNPFSVSVSNINTSGTVNTQSLFTGLSAKPRYILQRMGIGRTTALITNGLSEYLWVYLDDGKRLITFGVTTGQAFQTLTPDSTGLSYTNVDFFSATPSVITFKNNIGFKSFVTQVDANVTNSISNYTAVEDTVLQDQSVTLSIQPRLWYRFNTGDVTGSSLTNYGTLSGGNATMNSTSINTGIKKYGTGSLTISTSYVTMPAVTISAGIKFSISFWFYMTSATSSAGFVSFLTGYPQGFIYLGTTSNRLYFGFENKNYQTSLIITDTANWNKWHYVGVSFSNSANNIFNLNGTASTFSMTTSYSTTNYNVKNVIGVNALDNNNTNQWTGYIDSFRFFNDALTSTDLTNLYNEGLAQVTNVSLSISPMISYTFDEVNNNIISNSGTSGSTNNLTLSNGASTSSSIVKYGNRSLDLSGTAYIVNGTPGSNIQNGSMGAVTLTSNLRFSISFWFYITNRGSVFPMIAYFGTFGAGRIYVGLNNGPTGQSGNRLLIGYTSPPSDPYFQLESNGIPNVDLEFNTWNYFGWSTNSGTWTIRLNNNTTTITGMPNLSVTSFAASYLGVGPDGASAWYRQFSGYIDSFRFFDGALTATDLTNLYNEGPPIGILKFNLNRQLKYIPRTSTVTAYGSGTAGTTSLTETYTNAVEMYTSSNAYAVSQTTPSQYTMVEAITNANQKTTIAKTANTNVYFGPSGKGLYALEIPFNPSVSPSDIQVNINSTISYYVSNPDLAAERWSTYALSTSNTSVVQVGDLFRTYDNPSHTYTFTNVLFSTVGDKTLYIWSVVPDLCYNLLSFTLPVTAIYPCFLEGTKILRFNPETYQEEYTCIEKLRKNDLILTSESGYKAIHCIGYRTLFQPKNDPSPSNRLYKFTKSNCPTVFEPLYITGEHCTLHSHLSKEKLAEAKEHMGDIYITEESYRIPACIDDRAEPYDREDTPVTIWHFALENENVAHNYGVYANGLLVESCAIESFMQKSGMIPLE